MCQRCGRAQDSPHAAAVRVRTRCTDRSCLVVVVLLLQCGAVFNLELPSDARHYVHRAGRAGRMGREGLVLSIVDPSEAFVIDDSPAWLLPEYSKSLVLKLEEMERYLDLVSKREVKRPKRAVPLIRSPSLSRHRQQRATAEIRSEPVGASTGTSSQRGRSIDTLDHKSW